MGCCISRSSEEEGVIGPYPAGRRSSRISGSSRAINARRSRSMGGGTRSGSEAPETAAGTPAGSQLRGIGGTGRSSAVTNDDRHPLASHPPSGVTTTTSSSSPSSNQQQSQREQERQRRRQSRRHSSQQQHRDDRGGDQGRDRRSRHSRNLSQHINKPLKRHEWISHNRVWTRSALDRERAEFFDTRVTGRQEVWQTIHAALEILWHQAQKDAAAAAALATQNGEGTLAAPSDYEGEDRNTQHSDREEHDENSDRSIALATAQTILGAAEITLPTGDLAQGGAYDSLGNYYQLPEHVVSDPVNISTSQPASEAASSEYEEEQDGDEHDGYADADTKGTMSVEVADEEATTTEGGGEGGGALESGDEAHLASERQKGKAVVTSVKDLIIVRARLSDGSKDVNVQIDKADSVRVLGRKVAEKAKLSSDKKVRIAFMGKILKENSSLHDQGWKQGNIVNALVFNR